MRYSEVERAVRSMVEGRQAQAVKQELAAEAMHHTVGHRLADEPVGELLGDADEPERQREGDGAGEQVSPIGDEQCWKKARCDAGQRLLAEHVVDHQLQRQRHQQRERDPSRTERQDEREPRPESARLVKGAE
jgi:hypothetical protein